MISLAMCQLLFTVTRSLEVVYEHVRLLMVFAGKVGTRELQTISVVSERCAATQIDAVLSKSLIECSQQQAPSEKQYLWSLSIYLSLYC